MKFLFTALLSLAIASPGLCSQLNIVIVLDGSGSMGGSFSKSQERITKMEAARRALVQMVDGLPPNTNIGVICFSNSTNGWLYKLTPLNKNELKTAILSVREGGGTPLGRYMKDGADALLTLRAKQKSGVYKLVIVTDGESNDDADAPLVGKYGILSKGLKVEAIGVDMSKTHTLATKVPYRSAENPEELKTVIKAVVAESAGGKDHSEDYDIIAPLPPELAMVALQAISEFDNTPIGQKPKVEVDSPASGMSWVGVTFTVLGLGIGAFLIAVFIISRR